MNTLLPLFAFHFQIFDKKGMYIKDKKAKKK